jgi:glycosyltransferase involved in cell wall biosynthesis
MKILLASTIKRKVSSDMTYSRSRIVYELADGLAKRGHQVSLLGTADSHVDGVKIIPVIDEGFVDMSKKGGYENVFYAETGYLVKAVKKLAEIGNGFDIIHSHGYPEFMNLFASDVIKTPIVVTLHMSSTPQFTPEFDSVLSLFPKAYLIAISDSQKSHFIKSKIYDVVYNGVNLNSFPYSLEKEDYLLWFGRLGQAKKSDGTFVDAKGVSWAIRTAQKTGKKLILSGGVEDKEFFEKEVKPFLNDKIRWVGEISKNQPLSTREVADYYGHAKAFLMTPNWDEAFGLVIAESMSSGTPVIGFDKGSIPELVDDGENGFLSPYEEGEEGLSKSVEKLFNLSKSEYSLISEKARRKVEENFSVEKMVEGYEKVYGKILENR